jgi:peptidoglycan hydrolase CwlO-like protein
MKTIIKDRDSKIRQLNGTVSQLDKKIKDLDDKIINFEDKIRQLTDQLAWYPPQVLEGKQREVHTSGSFTAKLDFDDWISFPRRKWR